MCKQDAIDHDGWSNNVIEGWSEVREYEMKSGYYVDQLVTFSGSYD